MVVVEIEIVAAALPISTTSRKLPGPTTKQKEKKKADSKLDWCRWWGYYWWW